MKIRSPNFFFVCVVVWCCILLSTSSRHVNFITTVNAMSIISNTSLEKGIDHIECSTTDENGNSFFGLWTAPGAVTKLRMSDMVNLGVVYFNPNENYVSSVVYDFNDYIYASTYATPTSHLIKIQASTLNRIGVIKFFPTSSTSETYLSQDPESYSDDVLLHKLSAGIFLPTPVNQLVYATMTTPPKLIRLSVTSSFERSSAQMFSSTLQNGENMISTFVVSKNYILAGLQLKPAMVVRLNPSTLAREGGITLNYGEDYITFGFHMGVSASQSLNPGSVINRQNLEAADVNMFYFLCYVKPSLIVKVQANPLSRLSFLSLETPENEARTATPFPWMNLFVVGCSTWPGIAVVVNVSATTGEMTRWYSSWVPTSDRYFSTSAMVTPFTIPNASTTVDDRFSQISIIFGTDSGAASALTFQPLGVKNFTNKIVTYNGGGSLVGVARLYKDYLYAASDTRSGVLTKLAADTLQVVTTLRLPLGDDWLRTFVIDKWGNGHLGCCTTIGRLIYVNLGLMIRVSSLDGESSATEQCYHSSVFAPTLETDSTQYLYVSSYYGGRMIKFQVTETSVARLGVATENFPERMFTGGVLEISMGKFSLYGSFDSTGKIVKFNLQLGFVETTLTLPSGEGTIRDAAVFKNYGYFAVSPQTIAPGLVKVDVSVTPMQRIFRYNFGYAESFYSIVNLGDGTALLGLASSKIIKVSLESGSFVESLSTKGFAGVIECGTSYANDATRVEQSTNLPPAPPGAPPRPPPQQTTPANTNKNIAWMISYSSPSWVMRVDTTSTNSNAASALSSALIGAIAGGAGLLFLAVAATYFIASRRRTNRYDTNETDEPMLQVPRTTVNIVHSAMSIPSRDDMIYSDRVAVPPRGDDNRLDMM